MRFIVKWIPAFILGGALVGGIALNPGPEFGSLFGSPETKLTNEVANLTLPGVQVVNQQYDKGSGCPHTCPAMTIEYRFTPTPATKMESKLNTEMLKLGYSHDPSQTPPYIWVRGKYDVAYEWLAASDDNAVAKGHELADQLLVQWTYK